MDIETADNCLISINSIIIIVYSIAFKNACCWTTTVPAAVEMVLNAQLTENIICSWKVIGEGGIIRIIL